jgi:hypothetical protein
MANDDKSRVSAAGSSVSTKGFFERYPEAKRIRLGGM